MTGVHPPSGAEQQLAEPLLYAQFETPLGPLAVVTYPGATGDRPAGPSGPVIASGFMSLSALLTDRASTIAGRTTRPDDLPEIADVIARYFDGEVGALEEVSVLQQGGDFVVESWAVLRDVPAGEVVTYGQLASSAGRPRAARAAGTACATNQVAPFVPCHRVVPASGGVGSYGYGAQVKGDLLFHEGALDQAGEFRAGACSGSTMGEGADDR